MMKRTSRKFLFAAILLAAGFVFSTRAPLFSKDQGVYFQTAPSDQASVERGKEAYGQKCRWCHGAGGDGSGLAANFVFPKPRDFTRGEYKFRTTQSGEIPTDWDLFRTITKGLPGTSMYGWGAVLSEKDRWNLVAYLKTFSGRFQAEQYAKDKVLISPYPEDPGKVTPELLKIGYGLYHDPSGAKCFMCHGDHGRGNGPSSDTLTDDWNNKDSPADQTKGYDLRGGSSVQDIYRDISTGLEGSPMPSFSGVLDPDDKKDRQARWALAYYVRSLQVPRKLGSLVKAVRMDGEIPTDPKDPRWDKIDWIDIPIAGQILMEPRQFIPSVDNLSVKACYNEKSIAFLVYWDDRTQSDTEGPNSFPDALGIQFPIQAGADPSQSPKPYFGMGDSNHAVDLWYWNAEKNGAMEMNAWGVQKIIPKKENPNVAARSLYDDGTWKVVFTRPLKTSSSQTDLQLGVGKYVPISFAVWDGNNGETKGKKGISSWYYLLLIPPTSSKIFLAPLLAVAAGILLEFWAKNKARASAKEIL